MTTLASTIQAFFTDYLTRQRRASPHTVAAHRDSLRLLLSCAAHQTGKQPSRLEIPDLGAPLVGALLDHLENERGNSIRTRNARLAAIHALFSFAALRHLECAAVIQRVTAIPPKRFERKLVTYLTEPEAAALLAAPDTATRTGRRDRALLDARHPVRPSRLRAHPLTRADAFLGTGAHVTCTGKGRKQRITPLTQPLPKSSPAGSPNIPGPGRPLVPQQAGDPDEPRRSRTAPRETRRRGSPRPAVPEREENIASRPEAHRGDRLLAAGVDTTVIALWLGHETVATTQIYNHADLAIKGKALARTAPLDVQPGRYQLPDTLVAFLESL